MDPMELDLLNEKLRAPAAPPRCTVFDLLLALFVAGVLIASGVAQA